MIYCTLFVYFQNEPKNKITNVPQPFPEEALEIKDVHSNLPKPLNVKRVKVKSVVFVVVVLFCVCVGFTYFVFLK